MPTAPTYGGFSCNAPRMRTAFAMRFVCEGRFKRPAPRQIVHRPLCFLMRGAFGRYRPILQFYPSLQYYSTRTQKRATWAPVRPAGARRSSEREGGAHALSAPVYLTGRGVRSELLRLIGVWARPTAAALGGPTPPPPMSVGCRLRKRELGAAPMCPKHHLASCTCWCTHHRASGQG